MMPSGPGIVLYVQRKDTHRPSRSAIQLFLVGQAAKENRRPYARGFPSTEHCCVPSPVLYLFTPCLIQPQLYKAAGVGLGSEPLQA